MKDDFQCFVTGEKNKKLLRCHHLNSKDIHPEQRYDISNGITLTEKIHKAFHTEYGNGKNTREQFEKFLQERYNIFDYPWRNDDHEPTLSIEEIEARQASQEERLKEKLLLLISKRGHILLTANEGFKNRAPIEIYCPQHNCSQWTSGHNYRRARTGLICCGREVQSAKGTWEHVNEKRRKARESKSGFDNE
jgi:hypothetical protein